MNTAGIKGKGAGIYGVGPTAAVGRSRDNLSEAQFMYHGTLARNRASIAEHGLQVKYDDGGGFTNPGVYLSPQVSPHHADYHDVWRVNTTGMTLHDDPLGDEGGGEKYTREDVHPSRLTLHHEGDAARYAEIAKRWS